MKIKTTRMELTQNNRKKNQNKTKKKVGENKVQKLDEDLWHDRDQ